MSVPRCLPACRPASRSDRRAGCCGSRRETMGGSWGRSTFTCIGCWMGWRHERAIFTAKDAKIAKGAKEKKERSLLFLGVLGDLGALGGQKSSAGHHLM